MSSQVARRPFTSDPCNIEGCRSTRYRFDERGVAICRNGHEHPEIQERAAPEVEFEGAVKGATSRRRRVVTEARAGLQGREAYELYLTCLQHILRKQIWWLVKSQELPEDLEPLLQSLWSLRLAGLASRMNISSYSGDESDDRPTYNSQTETSSEEESGNASASVPKKKDLFSTSPNLHDNLAFCYLGIYLLRLPITIADILAWTQSSQLIYYRAILEIPRDMKDQLPGTYQNRLDPSVLLTSSVLWRAIRTLFMSSHSQLSLVIPPLNWPLHLFRHVHELTLPLTVYQTVKQLNKLIGFEFSYGNTSSLSRVSVMTPELQLMSLLVVAVKLLYPFDDPKLHAERADEPAAVAINWDIWTEALESSKSTASNNPPQLSYEKAMQITEDEIPDLANDQLDDYLDWYSETWARTELRERDRDHYFRQYLLDTFPTGPRTRPPPAQEPSLEQQHVAIARRTEAVLAGLTPRPVVTAEQAERSRRRIARPGDSYTRFQFVHQLSGNAKIFHEEAARVVGAEVKTLLKAVYHAERRLEVWALQERKGRKEGSDQDSIDEEK